MKRVVITGLGIISSIGNNKRQVLSSLKKLRSGIIFSEEMRNFGVNSQVWGKIKLDKRNIDRSKLKFMNTASLYAYIAMEQAIQDAGLKKSMYQKSYRAGVIAGTGCNFFSNDIYNKNNDIYLLIKTMPSNISACLSTFYHIYGISDSMSAACATSLSCINHAVELIRFGKQDIVFAGGAEAINCELAYKFDQMKVLSIKYNKSPKTSSRPYDICRDGFVISEGSGIVVLEELEHACARNSKIYAEVIGIGMTSHGKNMVQPSKSGLSQSMSMAIHDAGNVVIDYINTHATSTMIGDITELQAIKSIFSRYSPYFSSTKSITGHALGASGVHEVIYSILMMQNNFVFPNINISNLEPLAKNMNVVLKMKYVKLNYILSNSCGFGGFNSSIILKKYNFVFKE
ncbi:beta-ketoacyl synthase N-terminal-like domain-containing protein [Buchnera aphidicola]|uniref:beta-ketoacyl synthase N-terminal-like domain-containing protein n=1 Tax=Buchnera aphidicola TaxID=9 RepID=UPI0031B898C2